MMSYSPLAVGGSLYALGHLDSLISDTPSQKLGRLVRTGCRFTTRTFTEACALGVPHHLSDEGNRPRLFSALRHRLSFHLRGAMTKLSDGSIHVRSAAAADRNWLNETYVNVPGPRGTPPMRYEIFFAVREAEKKQDHDVEMIVNPPIHSILYGCRK